MGEAMITRRGGGGLKIDGLLDEYVVSSGSVSAGDFVKWIANIRLLNSQFATAKSSSYYYTAALIDDKRVVVIYPTQAGSYDTYYNTAIVVTFAGRSAYAGTPTIISDSISGSYGRAADVYHIDNGECIVMKRDSNLSSKYWSYARIKVTGSNITLLRNFAASDVVLMLEYVELAQLEPRLFAQCNITTSGISAYDYHFYRYNNGTFTRIAGYDFTSKPDRALYPVCWIKVNDEKYACLYVVQYGTATVPIYVAYFALNGDTVTMSAGKKLGSINEGGRGSCKISDDTYVIPCYGAQRDNLSYYYGAVTLTINNGELSPGTVTQISNTSFNIGGVTRKVPMCRLNGGRVLLINANWNYEDTAPYPYKAYIVNSIDGSTTLENTIDITNNKSTLPVIVDRGDGGMMVWQNDTALMAYNIGDDIAKCESGDYLGGLAASNGTANNTIKVYHPA